MQLCIGIKHGMVDDSEIFLRDLDGLALLFGTFTGLQALASTDLIYKLHQLHLR